MSARGTTVRLPEQFNLLQPFVERWAVAGIANRAALRSATTDDEQRAFYEATKQLIGPVLDYLDTRPVESQGNAESTLLNIVLTYAHIALAIEIQRDAEPRHATMRQFMQIVHEPAE